MTHRIRLILAAGVLASSAAGLWHEAAAASPQRRKAKAAPKAAKAAEAPRATDDNSPVDKKRFEDYLNGRIAKLNEQHKARFDFYAQETLYWNNFWNKIKDER